MADSVGARRRAAFARAVFERSSSLLSPSLWISVVTELPADYRAVTTLSTDWSTASWNRLSTWQRPALAGLVLLIVGLYWPALVVGGAYPVAGRNRFADASQKGAGGVAGRRGHGGGADPGRAGARGAC